MFLLCCDVCLVLFKWKSKLFNPVSFFLLGVKFNIFVVCFGCIWNLERKDMLPIFIQTAHLFTSIAVKLKVNWIWRWSHCITIMGIIVTLVVQQLWICNISPYIFFAKKRTKQNQGWRMAKSSFVFWSIFYSDHFPSQPTLPYNWFFFHFQAWIF